MFKKIYVPVDNSDHSDASVNFAVEFAKKFQITTCRFSRLRCENARRALQADGIYTPRRVSR